MLLQTIYICMTYICIYASNRSTGVFFEDLSPLIQVAPLVLNWWVSGNYVLIYWIQLLKQRSLVGMIEVKNIT